MKKLPIGRSDFKDLIEEKFFFVDKSLFIKEIIKEVSQITLLPRPRRFGKTLNLSMLRYFFERTDNKKEIKQIFSGLAIEKEEAFAEHLCRYPIIFLTFKEIKSGCFEEDIASVKRLIADEYRRHAYLLESESLNDFEKQDFTNIAAIKADISLFKNSLLYLSAYLHKHHKEKPIILIDEYDTPVIAAYLGNYYEKTINFFRNFLGAGLKDNTNIYKGVLTGILRVAKESIFSDMNNLGVYSLMREEYSDYFGFTEDEVKELASAYSIKHRFNDIKKWYDGYIFGKKTIYNPWSILNFISSKDKEYRPYWANTSSNLLIKDLLVSSSSLIKEELYDLLKDIPVVKRVEENIAFENLKDNQDTLYGFLLFSGYLKAHKCKTVEDEKYCKLQVPNTEVKLIFKDIILQWVNESYRDNDRLHKMLLALVQGEVKVFEEILNDFVLTTLSYFSTGKSKDVEKVYQAFVLGLLVNLALDYEVSSEKESGFGRYDISIIPKDINKKAIIMELKKIDSDETKDTALDSALAQIEEKKYETAIKARGVMDIEKFGVVFDGKRVWVKKKRSTDMPV
ncbi:MAG: AAA family ATPase [Desulfobacula sp.]|jgi:hypothetical protein|uniref:AAA family ATPase n=1 Tax=Desulfobacula sp. TaxID=2593537 RepID=UPI001EB1D41D|nr:AAA family ATPase [Desulfobacula sp.]